MDLLRFTGRQAAVVSMLAAAAYGGLLTSRKMLLNRQSAAEILSDALLDVTALTNPKTLQHAESFELMSSCVSYILQATMKASPLSAIIANTEDIRLESRTQTHPYTHTRVDFTTEAGSPEPRFSFTVHIPDFGEVRGTRLFGKKQLSGVSPVQIVRDQCQFNIKDGTNLQMETDLLIPALGKIGGYHVHGSIVVRDETGNIARLYIDGSGNISGALTSCSRVIGRFEGNALTGLHLKKYVSEAA